MSTHHHHTGTSVENVGEKIGSNIRGVFTGLRGSGDVLRGNMMGAVDSLFHDKDAQQRDEEIIHKGQTDVRDEEARLRDLRDGHAHADANAHPDTYPHTQANAPVQGQGPVQTEGTAAARLAVQSGQSREVGAQPEGLHEHHHLGGKMTGQGSHFH